MKSSSPSSVMAFWLTSAPRPACFQRQGALFRKNSGCSDLSSTSHPAKAWNGNSGHSVTTGKSVTLFVGAGMSPEGSENTGTQAGVMALLDVMCRLVVFKNAITDGLWDFLSITSRLRSKTELGPSLNELQKHRYLFRLASMSPGNARCDESISPI